MKHNKGKFPSDADLSNNPGIGTSKGTIKEGDDLALEGENTIEGDIEDDIGQGRRHQSTPEDAHQQMMEPVRSA